MKFQKVSTAIHSLLATLTIALGLTFAPEAKAGVPYPSNLYLLQATDVTCTLCSNTMMMRARMYRSNNSNWSSITEWGVRPYGWIEGAGQRSTYSYSIAGCTMNINQAYCNGMTVSQLQSILNQHPEGVCVYCSGIPHAQWVTDIDGGVVYSGDSSGYTPAGRYPISKTWQGYYYGSQENILAHVTSYWYVQSYSIPANTDYGQGDANVTQKTQNLPNGTYRIACFDNPKYGLDVSGGSTADEANVQVWEYIEGTKQQQFEVTFNKDHYNIKAVHSGKHVDLYNGLSAPGTNVFQYKPDGTAVQNWCLESAGDGAYYIHNNNGLFMDAKGGTIANGTNVQGYTGNKSNAQKWFFIAVDGAQTIPDGDYEIRSLSDFNYGVEVGGVSLEASANVQLWTLANSGSGANQKWGVKYMGNGYYSIRAKHTDMALNVKGGTAKSATVQQYPFNETDAASLWMIKQANDGSFYVINKNGLFLDLSNGTVANGTNIGGWCGNSSNAQKWYFTSVNGEQTVEDGIYVIRSAANQSYGLDVASVSMEDKGTVHLWSIAESGAGENQKWEVRYISDGYYSIVAHHSGKALDVADASYKAGADIQQYANTSATNQAQQWIIKEAAPGKFYIVNRKGLFVDINGGTIANGTNIQGWQGNRSIAQQWVFDVVELDRKTPVESIDLGIEEVELEVGKTGTLTPTILPADASNKKLNWSSSNTAVATVNNGVVTAVAEGTATITATSASNPEVSASCVFTVIPPVEPPHPTTYSLEQQWSSSDVPVKADARQATTANGKLYIQDKANQTIHIYDQNGKMTGTLTDSGSGTQISSDEAGNIIVRYGAPFPNVWSATEKWKVYIGGSNTNTKIIDVPNALPTERQDYFGKMRGDIINGNATMAIVSSTSATVTFLNFSKGAFVNSKNVTSIVAGSNLATVNHVVGDYYVAQPARSDLKTGIRLATFNGTNYDDSYQIYTPDLYASAGISGVELMGTKYLAYNTGSGYYDGFKIVKIENANNVTKAYSIKSEPIVEVGETTTSSTSGYQTNWVLFEKIDEYHTHVYHYFPGGYITCYNLSAPDKSEVETVVEPTSNAVVIGGIGEINVIGETNNVEVYSISGGLVSRGKTQVNVNPGAYIVRVDGKTTKVVVK